MDLEKLQAAVEQVFEIHPEMKAVIQPSENGALVCLRDDAKEIHIPIIEISDEEWDNAKEQLIQPFMYTENEPLFHAGIYKTDSSAYLFFDLAHIMGDGMSINIMFEDINAIYNGKVPQKQNYTMYEYALDEMDCRQRGIREECIAYFQKQIYIMDYPTKDYVDKVASPYEDGMLYQTGRTARITYDGRVEFLENTGRRVMLETLRGRVYVDLLQVEKVLCECEGVTGAEAYNYYGGDKKYNLRHYII